MKRLCIFLVCLMILTACSTQTQQQNQAPTPTSPSSPQQQIPQQPSLPQSIPTPKKELTPDAKKIVDSISKVTSYGFSNTNGVVYLKGNKVRIDLYQNRGATADTKFDTVYLDLENKVAYGLCKDVGLCSYDLRQKYRQVSYKEFDLGKLPPEYTKEITSGEIDYSKTRQIKKHAGLAPVSLFKYAINDVNYESWLDNFYGFPYEITLTKNGNSTFIQFSDVQINGVTDQDVTLPSGLTFVK